MKLSFHRRDHSVSHLGFTPDCNFTMVVHVSSITHTCIFYLYHLTSIHGFLTNTEAFILVFAFILETIDFCKSLLFVSPHDLTFHFEHEFAGVLVDLIPTISSTSILLNSIQWLPVKTKSTYEIA